MIFLYIVIPTLLESPAIAQSPNPSPIMRFGGSPVLWNGLLSSFQIDSIITHQWHSCFSLLSLQRRRAIQQCRRRPEAVTVGYYRICKSSYGYDLKLEYLFFQAKERQQNREESAGRTSCSKSCSRSEHRESLETSHSCDNVTQSNREDPYLISWKVDFGDSEDCDKFMILNLRAEPCGHFWLMLPEEILTTWAGVISDLISHKYL